MHNKSILKHSHFITLSFLFCFLEVGMRFFCFLIFLNAFVPLKLNFVIWDDSNFL